MSGFKYIIRDFRELSPEEQQQMKVRCGAIDPALVFQHIYGFHGSTQHILMTKAIIDSVLPTLTRCQRDLLMIEFGQDETSLADVLPMTDALEDPLDANIKKLQEAIIKIQSYLSF